MSSFLQVLVECQKLLQLPGSMDFLACRCFMDDLLSLVWIRITSARLPFPHVVKLAGIEVL